MCITCYACCNILRATPKIQQVHTQDRLSRPPQKQLVWEYKWEKRGFFLEQAQKSHTSINNIVSYRWPPGYRRGWNHKLTWSLISVELIGPSISEWKNSGCVLLCRSTFLTERVVCVRGCCLSWLAGLCVYIYVCVRLCGMYFPIWFVFVYIAGC